jgi:hypothetical protein
MVITKRICDICGRQIEDNMDYSEEIKDVYTPSKNFEFVIESRIKKRVKLREGWHRVGGDSDYDNVDLCYLCKCKHFK